MKIKALPFCTGLLALGLASCVSPKFQRAWKSAPEQCWTGHWHSVKHDAGGRLRAVLSPPDHGKMDAFFEAQWHGFTTAYLVSLDAKRVGKKEGEGFSLDGQKELKSLVGGGLYTYKATLTPNTFSAEYASSYDYGTFELVPAR
jgi:hypothetical protein